VHKNTANFMGIQEMLAVVLNGLPAGKKSTFREVFCSFAVGESVGHFQNFT
jgi:hypothetical protein